MTKDTASEHPFIITSEASPVTLENINLINPYNGIDLSRSGTCCLRGLYGSPLNVGLTADRSFAVSAMTQFIFHQITGHGPVYLEVPVKMGHIAVT